MFTQRPQSSSCTLEEQYLITIPQWCEDRTTQCASPSLALFLSLSLSLLSVSVLKHTQVKMHTVHPALSYSTWLWFITCAYDQIK